MSTKGLISNCGAGEELESPLDCKTKLVNPKGNQPWICIGRTDAKAEAPIFGLPDKKSWFIGKEELMLGKTEGETRKGQQMLRCVRQHHQLKGDELEQTQGDVQDSGVWSAAVHRVASRGTTEWMTTTCEKVGFS